VQAKRYVAGTDQRLLEVPLGETLEVRRVDE
jgi:hypothetical protein